jgi:hypothetical protein
MIIMSLYKLQKMQSSSLLHPLPFLLVRWLLCALQLWPGCVLAALCEHCPALLISVLIFVFILMDCLTGLLPLQTRILLFLFNMLSVLQHQQFITLNKFLFTLSCCNIDISLFHKTVKSDKRQMIFQNTSTHYVIFHLTMNSCE